jgi:hypothetical protein
MNALPLLAGLAAAGVAGLAVHSLVVEPASVEVTEHELPLPDLPAAWQGARVVHITDLHYGNPRSEQLFRWLVETVGGLEPDLILLTGDVIVRREREVKPAVERIAGLRAKHGVLGVLGDHDFDRRHKVPMPGIIEGLTEAGVRLLRNEQVELPGGLRVAGIDPSTHKIHAGDLERALAKGHPHLLLSHSPDIIPEAAALKVPMVLCGHTHGGQVVIPFYGPPVTHTDVGREYASGWSRRGETRMYTCRGLGSHYSLRFWCRPEIAVFTLRQA